MNAFPAEAFYELAKHNFHNREINILSLAKCATLLGTCIWRFIGRTRLSLHIEVVLRIMNVLALIAMAMAIARLRIPELSVG